ncbi:hypothetical protein AAZX31_20G210400 [Glycine max]
MLSSLIISSSLSLLPKKFGVGRGMPLIALFFSLLGKISFPFVVVKELLKCKMLFLLLLLFRFSSYGLEETRSNLKAKSCPFIPSSTTLFWEPTAGIISNGTMSNSLADFCILKRFVVASHLSRKLQSIKQVDCKLPPAPWIKCNTNDAARGNLGRTGSGRLIINNNGSFLGGFASSFGNLPAFHRDFGYYCCYSNGFWERSVSLLAGNRFLIAYSSVLQPKYGSLVSLY